MIILRLILIDDFILVHQLIRTTYWSRFDDRERQDDKENLELKRAESLKRKKLRRNSLTNKLLVRAVSSKEQSSKQAAQQDGGVISKQPSGEKPLPGEVEKVPSQHNEVNGNMLTPAKESGSLTREKSVSNGVKSPHKSPSQSSMSRSSKKQDPDSQPGAFGKCINWFCGLDSSDGGDSEDGTGTDAQLFEHLDSVASLRQTASEKTVLRIALIFCCGIALTLYVAFSLDINLGEVMPHQAWSRNASRYHFESHSKPDY